MLPAALLPNDSFSRRTASDVLSIRSSCASHSSRRQCDYGTNDNHRWEAGPFDAGEAETGAVARRPAAMSRTVSARIATEPLNVVLSDLRRTSSPLGFGGPSQGRTPSPSAIPEEVSASPFSQSAEYSGRDADMMEMDASYESSSTAVDFSSQLFTGEETYSGESAERWRVLGRCWKDHLSHCKGGPKGSLCRGAPASGFA